MSARERTGLSARLLDAADADAAGADGARGGGVAGSDSSTSQVGDFSKEALDSFMESAAGFVVDLERLSRFIAKRSGHEVVQRRDVERAGEFLGAGRAARFARHVGTAGGTLLGAGLSTLFQMLVENSYPLVGVIISITCTAVGLSAAVYHSAKE